MDIGEQINQIKIALWDLNYTYWKDEILFSGRWWILIALNAISYAIWWKLVNKRRLPELLLFGSLISVGRIVMDIVGSNTVLWSYNIRETPFMPSPFLHDFTISPLAYMLAYQYSSTWLSFTLWNLVTAGGISLVFLPILASFGYLTLINWNYPYTFILMLFLASLSRFVVRLSYQIGKNLECQQEHSNTILVAQPALKPANNQDTDK